ncbi:unnamed protein product [Vitrella brassicaformis CCMP3155]|uniref:Uncharacterized protein n=1 Tax=Vitrella brassicaformis (strain CCMP3155) TaxID=1169540 RepID=A0A0G4GX79_VITBC|nr:unnamed protein product [Vitrella brassicaformis CCMP3155]|eukprot:CEM35663.1 unnamed protein product [Vitrella brassicaformis CCMP3155]
MRLLTKSPTSAPGGPTGTEEVIRLLKDKLRADERAKNEALLEQELTAAKDCNNQLLDELTDANFKKPAAKVNEPSRVGGGGKAESPPAPPVLGGRALPTPPPLPRPHHQQSPPAHRDGLAPRRPLRPLRLIHRHGRRRQGRVLADLATVGDSLAWVFRLPRGTPSALQPYNSSLSPVRPTEETTPCIAHTQKRGGLVPMQTHRRHRAAPPRHHKTGAAKPRRISIAVYILYS